jgi:hypothetical protein
VEFHLDLTIRDWPLIGFGMTASGTFEDGSIGEIGAANFAIAVCGCATFYAVPDPPSDNNPQKFVTLRLNGEIVAQAQPPGFNMWGVALPHVPESWRIEILEGAPGSELTYRVVWRFDAPAPVTLTGGGGGIADEVEVRVVADAGLRGAPVDLTQAVLSGGTFSQPGAYLIEGEMFLFAATCPADLSHDGTVGPLDLAQLLASWGPCPRCAADMNHDDAVGPADLAALLAGWGQCK